MENKQIAVLIRKNKGRMTPIKEALLKTFIESKQPLSATELTKTLKSKGFLPDKTTVYRQIEFLISCGLVREVRLNEDLRRFEFITDDHVHHLICKSCDNVSNVVLRDDLENVERQIKSDSGFEVQQHTLEFYGICGDCQRTLSQ